MPPKKQPKPDKAKQQKSVVDKTFGMKNKKGASTQKQIKAIKNNIMGQGKSEQFMMEEEQKKKEAKKKLAEEKALMASLFNVVPKHKSAKMDDDVDPKTLLCQFFKQGLCQKGRKCKYSHDLNIENQNKTQVINLYQDQREQLTLGEGNKEEDNMEDWDTEKLNEVVQAQQNKYKSQIPTEIVCKFFLEAVNNNKYGWRWVCPNGMKCHYRHCLPPGFILKKDIQKKEKEDLSKLEEKIDEQITNLSFKGKQKVTYEIFLEWKEKRKLKKEQEKLEKEKEKEKANKKKPAGKFKGMTGLAIFMENPELFKQDQDEAGDDDINYNLREGEEEVAMPQQSVFDDTDFSKRFKPKRALDEAPPVKGDEEESKGEETKEQEKQPQEETKQEDEVPESWDQESDDQAEKKKKKKKKKKSGDVKIDDDAFLEDA